MIKTVKKDTGDVIFMRFMKHYCPVCHNQLKVVRLTRVVRSVSREGGLNVCNLPINAKEKSIWYEFKCRECNVRFSEKQIKMAEYMQKQKQKRAQKLAKKAEKAQGK